MGQPPAAAEVLPHLHPHAFLGLLFGIDDSAVRRYLNPLQPLLTGISRIPERRVGLAAEDRALFFDATERPTRRPQRWQQASYSGKEKRPTLTAQVAVVQRRQRPGPGAKPRRVRIASVAGTFPGSAHDQEVYDRARLVCPPGVARSGDTGYVGTGLEVPAKRPPKGRLTARQKAGNRRLARRRVVAEHGTSKMKACRWSMARYRGAWLAAVEWWPRTTRTRWRGVVTGLWRKSGAARSRQPSPWTVRGADRARGTGSWTSNAAAGQAVSWPWMTSPAEPAATS